MTRRFASSGSSRFTGSSRSKSPSRTKASVAVAVIGYMMLTGRFDWRRGVVTLVGIFIIFGAVTIVAGIRSLAGGL